MKCKTLKARRKIYRKGGKEYVGYIVSFHIPRHMIKSNTHVPRIKLCITDEGTIYGKIFFDQQC